jgi:hypothetical protein
LSRGCRPLDGRRWIVLAFVLVQWAEPGPALAYRPFDSTDADVADAGELELELGPIGHLREGASKFRIAPAVIANFGLKNERELVLEGRASTPMGTASDNSQTVFGDTALSLKQIHRRGTLQEEQGVSIASECGVLLAEINGSPGTGAGCAGIVSHRARWATAHVNLGGFLDREHHWKSILGFILEGPYAWPVRPVMELVFDRNSSGAWSNGALVGMIWRVQDHLAFDMAVRAARTNAEPVYEWRAGFTWAFQVVKR